MQHVKNATGNGVLLLLAAAVVGLLVFSLPACSTTPGNTGEGSSLIPMSEPGAPSAVVPDGPSAMDPGAPSMMEPAQPSDASEGEQTMAKPAESALTEPTAADASSAAGTLALTIGGTAVAVAWEDNASVEALRALAEGAPLTIQLSMYGGFEQVGSIGQSLPRDDKRTTTSAGDIVLYSGNQIVIFYGSNSWSYTRLGHITDKTASEMAALLGNGNVAISLTVE